LRQQALHFKEYDMNDNVAAITLLEVLQPRAAGSAAEAVVGTGGPQATAAAAAVKSAGGLEHRPQHKYLGSPDREAFEGGALGLEQRAQGDFGRRRLQGMKRCRSTNDDDASAGHQLTLTLNPPALHPAPPSGAAAGGGDGDTGMDLDDEQPKLGEAAAGARTTLAGVGGKGIGGGQSGRSFLLVGNTHILFNPKRGEVKLGQLRTLLMTLEKLREEGPAIISAFGGGDCSDGRGDVVSNERDGGPQWQREDVGAVAAAADGTGSENAVGVLDIPVLVMGDMNLAPHSPMYHYMQRGFLDCLLHHRKDLAGEQMRSWVEGMGSVGGWAEGEGLSRQEVQVHAITNKWKYLGEKFGSGVEAKPW
jgi:hypothetical protein